MDNINTASLLLAVLAIIVAIAAFVLDGDPKTHRWRIALGILFFFIAVLLGAYGVAGFVVSPPSSPTEVPTAAASSEVPPTAAPVPTVQSTPTPELAPTQPPAAPPSTVIPTDLPIPTASPNGDAAESCALGTAYTSPPVWLPTSQGDVRTFLHCPPAGAIQYAKIAVDDELSKVEKVCSQGTTDITALFEPFWPEQLIHYRSQPIQLESGCAIAFTVRDVQGENIGLYIKEASSGQEPPVLTPFCAFVTLDQVRQLPSFQKAEDAIREAEKMAGYRQNDYDPGDTIPANVLIATNLLTSEIEQFGVTPVNNIGGYGLFLTTREFTAPNDGTYWCIR